MGWHLAAELKLRATKARVTLTRSGLVEGGARQEPGAPVYTRPMTVAKARAYFSKEASTSG